MSEVLVLIDAPDGKVSKPSLELLTIARTIGEPSAVVFGSDVPGTLAEYGAEKVYQLDDAVYDEYLVGPKAEALAQLVADKSPAAVLVPSTFEGKEIAARVALKAESGLITDAVDKKQSEIAKCVQEYRFRSHLAHAKVSVNMGIDQEGRAL